METERRYYEDPLKFEFTADVIETFPLKDGRCGVVLPQTYFYATGGGQEHDTGDIGGQRVVNVYKDEARGIVVHVLEHPLNLGQYPARIDPARRLRSMRHHTGQHLLSSAFVHVLGIDSLSANINWDTPSTIDLDTGDVAAADLQRVEEYANGVIFADLAVKSYFAGDADVPRIPFRKPPAVTGRIRVVEIDGLDYTPCGGTHCLHTGMIGLLKIVRTERQNQKLRVHFVAGEQALQVFRQYQGVIQALVNLLGTGTEELAASVSRQLDRLKQAQVELDALRTERLSFEAHQLVQTARPMGDARLIAVLFRDRPPADLRTLANALRQKEGVVGVLGNFDGQKFSLVVCCGTGTGVDARALLARLISGIHGRGGGEPSLAQGGGAAGETKVADLWADVERLASA